MKKMHWENRDDWKRAPADGQKAGTHPAERRLFLEVRLSVRRR